MKNVVASSDGVSKANALVAIEWLVENVARHEAVGKIVCDVADIVRKYWLIVSLQPNIFPRPKTQEPNDRFGRRI